MANGLRVSPVSLEHGSEIFQLPWDTLDLASSTARRAFFLEERNRYLVGRINLERVEHRLSINS
jgi:hypothetical protein